MKTLIFHAVLVLISLGSSAQPFTKPYIMSFHSCPYPACGTPQNHTVHLAESDDAETWTLVNNFPSYTGSVPDVITRGQKLYIYTPGKVKRYDQNLNQWETNTSTVTVLDSIGNPVQFVDPSAFINDAGLICLFFLNSTGITGDPAYCANPPCTAYFDSAIEVPGSDGTQFIIQTGHRISYITNSNFKPTDPDIFQVGTTYYQYISYGTGTIVYASNQLHGTYTIQPSLPNGYLTTQNAGVPSGIFIPNTQLIHSFGHRNGNMGTEISFAKHADFLMQPNYSTSFSGPSIGLGNVQVASPGVCSNTFISTSTSNELLKPYKTKLYPNPSHGSFTLQSDNDIVSYKIVDMYGKCLVSQPCVPNKLQTISVKATPGLYIIHCFHTNHETTMHQFRID